MAGRGFIKMHGLGNDFVVIDGRAGAVSLAPDLVRAIADRRQGVGCDQLVLLEAPPNGASDAVMRIYNADGGEVEACGNAARCIGAHLMAESGAKRIRLMTGSGLVVASRAADGAVTVDMGAPKLHWRDIPLASETDTLIVPVALGPLEEPCAVSMGNPHAIFFVDDADLVDLATLGPQLEMHPMFPARANIEVAQVTGAGAIRMRVWERGAGITRACGTGACATLVAAHRRGLTGRHARLTLDGGVLEIEWGADDHVRMTGPVATVFTGTLSEALSP